MTIIFPSGSTLLFLELVILIFCHLVFYVLINSFLCITHSCVNLLLIISNRCSIQFYQFIILLTFLPELHIRSTLNWLLSRMLHGSHPPDLCIIMGSPSSSWGSLPSFKSLPFLAYSRAHWRSIFGHLAYQPHDWWSCWCRILGWKWFSLVVLRALLHWLLSLQCCSPEEQCYLILNSLYLICFSVVVIFCCCCFLFVYLLILFGNSGLLKFHGVLWWLFS